MRIRQSLCYSLFKPEGSSLAEFFREARDMGYAAIEFWFRDKMGDDWEEVVGTAREQGLAVASRCGHHSLAKGLNDPAGHERIEAELRPSIEVAARHGPISYQSESQSESHLTARAAEARLAIRDVRTIPALEDAIAGSHDRRWIAPAMELLARLGHEPVRALAGPFQGEITLAAIRCARILNDGEALARMRELLDSREPAVAHAAVECLVAGPMDEALRARLLRLLDDRELAAETRLRILEALPVEETAGAVGRIVQDPALEGTELLRRSEELAVL